MIRTVKISKQNFERILHGNRSIPDDNFGIGETIQFMCEDWVAHSYPIEATIKSKYESTVKTTAGIRTSRFPFV